MDSEPLRMMLDKIASEKLEIHSVLIVRHGYIVMEAYAAPFGKDDLHIVKSCSKSVVSALVGIALREGYLASLDQRVVDILPHQRIANLDDYKQMITIRDLLTMSSGITRQEDGPNFGNYLNSSDCNQYYLNQPMAAQPGKLYAYDSAGANLLMPILRKTSGMSNSDFANKFLFKPIGIKNYYWQKVAHGDYQGGYGLALTPMDMARFGYLYLKNGRWNGQQIVPAEWVETSVSNHVGDMAISPLDVTMVTKGPDNGYGFLWWLNAFGGFSAHGNSGQYIIVMPEKDMVVVFTSGARENSLNTIKPLLLTEEYVNKSVVEDSNLPEDSIKSAALASAIRDFENPPVEGATAFPKTANRISGKKFLLDPNPLSCKSILVRFSGTDECTAEEEYPGFLFFNYLTKIPIGLDGKFRVSHPYSSVPDTSVYHQEFRRGTWIDEDTFLIERYQPWTDPRRILMTFRFHADRLQITIASSAGESKLVINGKSEN
jgi:CubicO group peptidase (beta-lactamase class C family)